MNKVKPVVAKDPETGNEVVAGYYFHCPACGHGHVFYVDNPVRKEGPKWTFNGNLENPTFEPSLLNWIDGHGDVGKYTCHLNCVDGVLIFHGDCTHGLANQRVPLPDVDDGDKAV